MYNEDFRKHIEDIIRFNRNKKMPAKYRFLARYIAETVSETILNQKQIIPSIQTDSFYKREKIHKKKFNGFVGKEIKLKNI